MSFTVGAKVNLSEVLAKIQWTIKQIRAGKNLILVEMVTHGFHFMRGIASSRTGRLISSIQTKVSENEATVGPTVHYAPYLEHGTRPSPGRYVPAIGKRLINPALPSFGMHPGIKPQPFVEPTRVEMEAFGRRVAEGIMARMIE